MSINKFLNHFAYIYFIDVISFQIAHLRYFYVIFEICLKYLIFKFNIDILVFNKYRIYEYICFIIFNTFIFILFHYLHLNELWCFNYFLYFSCVIIINNIKSEQFIDTYKMWTKQRIYDLPKDSKIFISWRSIEIV